MNTVLLAILGYVLVQFAIGVWLSRGMRNDTDYIVAGRTLSLPLIIFPVFATFFGSEALTATSASVYEKGLAGALVDPFCYGIAIIIVGLFFAARLRGRDLVTFADLFRNRFSPTVERLVVFVLLPGSIFWAAAQIRVFGVMLNSSAGMGLASGLLIAAVAVGIYSVVGGLLADAVTDMIQGLVVMAGLLLMTWAVSNALGDKGLALANIPPARWNVLDGDISMLGLIEKIAVPVCGTIVAVELISRFLGARTTRVAAWGTVLGGVLYIAFGLLPIYLGFAGSLLMPGVKETEEIVPKLAEAVLSPALHVLFVGAIISAVLSTVHSTLHAPAAQVSHNLINRIWPTLGDRQRLLLVRAAVAGLTAIAYLLASTSETIKDLVETASAFGSAGVFVAMLFGIFTRFGGADAALSAIVAGIVLWAWSKYVWALNTPYLLALAAAFVAYVVVAFVEQRSEGRVQR
jgi:Na+/proline symporter